MIHTKSNNRFYPIAGHKGYFINKNTTEVLCTNEDLPVILDQIPNSLGKDNYYIVVLGDSKNHFIHRLMALTFLPYEENREFVNHKDGNKQNNSIDNLEWCTSRENTQHAHRTGLIDYTKLYNEVHQYELSGKYIQSFESDRIATKKTGIAWQNISKCTLGKREQAGGYQWKRQKFEYIPKVDAKILQYIRIEDHSGKVTLVSPTGQDFYTEASKIMNCSKRSISTALSTKGNGFIKSYKVEKIYYK